jgi:ribonucleotide monophosphatase NagD (HAD superfamily)
MRELASRFSPNDQVLVIGSEGCLDAAKSYGFDSCFSSRDVISQTPAIWPFSNPGIVSDRFDVRKGVKAIMMFHDSRDWGLDLQVSIDLLR